jgi:hypothetical protein
LLLGNSVAKRQHQPKFDSLSGFQPSRTFRRPTSPFIIMALHPRRTRRWFGPACFWRCLAMDKAHDRAGRRGSGVPPACVKSPSRVGSNLFFVRRLVRGWRGTRIPQVPRSPTAFCRISSWLRVGCYGCSSKSPELGAESSNARRRAFSWRRAARLAAFSRCFSRRFISF